MATRGGANDLHALALEFMQCIHLPTGVWTLRLNRLDTLTLVVFGELAQLDEDRATRLAERHVVATRRIAYIGHW